MTDPQLAALADTFRHGAPSEVLAAARTHGPQLVEAVLTARRELHDLREFVRTCIAAGDPHATANLWRVVARTITEKDSEP